MQSLDENEISRVVMDEAFCIHRTMGPGLLESVYEVVLAKRLQQAGLKVKRQVPNPIVFEGLRFDEGFRADVLVEGKVIVELKSVEHTLPIHSKQLLTYLKLSDCRLGLLVNFGNRLLKDGFKRVANCISPNRPQSICRSFVSLVLP